MDAAPAAVEPYTVALDVFHGPLDLLLYLIRRDELDICDIPIARITDSFLHHVTLLRQMAFAAAGGGDHPAFDLSTAGDFLVVAATLMEIKSALLLPPPPATDDKGEPTAAAQLADPRFELVQQLLEYKRFKDAGAALEARQREHDLRFPRWPAKLDDEPADEPRRSTWTRCRCGTCSRRSTEADARDRPSASPATTR